MKLTLTASEESNINDQHWIFRATTAHESVLFKPDAFMAQKLLSTTKAPHLRTSAIVKKLHEFAEVIELETSTTLT